MENNKFIAIIIFIVVFYFMGLVTGIEYEKSCMKEDKKKFDKLQLEKLELEVQHLEITLNHKLNQ